MQAYFSAFRVSSKHDLKFYTSLNWPRLNLIYCLSLLLCILICNTMWHLYRWPPFTNLESRDSVEERWLWIASATVERSGTLCCILITWSRRRCHLSSYACLASSVLSGWFSLCWLSRGMHCTMISESMYRCNRRHQKERNDEPAVSVSAWI